MKVTQLGRAIPVGGLTGLAGGGGEISGTNPDTGLYPGSGLVPTSTGSNTWAWGSNVARITANGSNALLGPFVAFASGTGIAFAASSNTLTISSTVTGGGGGGGGGAPTTVPYVTLLADATLSAEKVRADLYRYSPDNTPTTAVSVGHEFNDGGHGSFSWAPSDPTTNDVTTYPGYLKASVHTTTRFYNKAWSPGASDLTAACALDMGTLINSNHVGLYLAGATGNNPAEGILVQLNVSASGTAVQVDCYTITGGAYTLFGSAQSIFPATGPNPPRIYLRLTRVVSGPTWQPYWSTDGRNWQAYGTTSNKSLTVAAIGLRCSTDTGTATFAVPFIRGWASVLETIGS